VDVPFLLGNAGALATAALGALALIRPAAAAAFASIQPVGVIGISEVRATYGGLFLALGGYALASQAPAAFFVAGLAWLGAAGGRCVSVLADRSTSPKNLGGVVFEAVIGALLLAR
jgi:hypothetical protein